MVKDVEWYKDDQQIRRGPKYSLEAEGKILRLTVKDVDSKDIAEYKVVAKNSRSAAKLTIEAPPSFFNVEKVGVLLDIMEE